MKWEWIDFDKMLYHVPYDKNKSKKIIMSPMTLLLQTHLMKLTPENKGYIFKGTGSTGHISSTGIDFNGET